MSKQFKTTIEVQGTSIAVLTEENGDYISLTDMVRSFDGGGALIEQWLKNKDTILFPGVWERIHSPDFNSPELEGIRNEAMPQKNMRLLLKKRPVRFNNAFRYSRFLLAHLAILTEGRQSP